MTALDTSSDSVGPAFELLEPRLLLSGTGVGLEDLAAAGAPVGSPPAGEDQVHTATHSFARGSYGSHPNTASYASGQITADLSALPDGTQVFRAMFVHNADLNSGTSSGANAPLQVEAADEPGVWLTPVAPRHIYLDVTAAVQRALLMPAKQLVLNVLSWPGFTSTSWREFRFDVTCDQPLPAGHAVEAVTDVTVAHRDGDTMITWDEPLDLLMDPAATVDDYVAAVNVANGGTGGPTYRYRVYRSDVPIDETTIRSAELVDEIAPLSNWNPYYYGVYWQSNPTSVVPRLPVDDAVISDTDQAIYVRRADAEEAAYYAVSLVADGEEDLSSWTAGENAAAAAVAESAGTGMVLLTQHVHYGVGEYFMYVGSGLEGPDLYYYVRWDCPPAYNMPSSAFDYLVAVPPEVYRVDPAPVDVALHCWGANLNGGYGWWYEAENGALLVSTNMRPYDWWTAYHDNYGTILPFADVEGNPDGRVRNYPADRILSFLDDFVAASWNVDADRVLVTGNSMGGAGCIMWGARAADRFAYANGWVGVYIPAQSPQFTGSFESCYGREQWGFEHEDTGLAAFEYWDSARYVLEDPGRQMPYLSFANGKNDGAIGWHQAWEFVSALSAARQPFKFVWGQSGHGQRAVLPGEQQSDRWIGVEIRKDQTLPAFTNCSQDGDVGNGDPGVGDPSGSINRYLLWDPATSVDQESRWEMDVYLIAASPDVQATVDVTPRRTQQLWCVPGRPYEWTNTDVASGVVVASGTGLADEYGLVTIQAATVSKTRNRIAVRAAIPGDATFDDAVDGADYTAWADNYHKAGTGWGGGDFNGDGFVDGADYTIWSDYYGQVAPAAEALQTAAVALRVQETAPAQPASPVVIGRWPAEKRRTASRPSRRSFRLEDVVTRPGSSFQRGGAESQASPPVPVHVTDTRETAPARPAGLGDGLNVLETPDLSPLPSH